MFRKAVAVTLSLFLVLPVSGFNACQALAAIATQTRGAPVHIRVVAAPLAKSDLLNTRVAALEVPAFPSWGRIEAASKVPQIFLQVAKTPAHKAFGRVPRKTAQKLVDFLRKPLPDFRRMGSSELKGGAEADFRLRLGENPWAKDGSVAAGEPAARNIQRRSRLAPASGHLNARRPVSVSISPLSFRLSRSYVSYAGIAAMAMAGSLLSGNFVQLLITGVLLFFSLVFHEMGHAKVAEVLGDSGPRLQNRLSLSWRGLRSHIDPILTILLPMATLWMGGFIFGGAKPVLVDARKFKNPEVGMALVALAGPMVNVAIALFAAGILWMPPVLCLFPQAAPVLASLIYINLLLAAFNLVPLPPLDGGHVLRYLWPGPASTVQEFLARGGLMLQLFWISAIAMVFSGIVMRLAAVATAALVGAP